MPALRRILVAIKDPRARSLPGLTKAAQLAHACGADLELFHSIADPVPADSFLSTNGKLFDYQRALRKGYLDSLSIVAAPLRHAGLTVNVAAEWDFPAHEAIVRRAQETKADLIVAECHAGRRLAPWLMHVTDWELLKTSPLPVLLVKSPRPWKRPVVLASVDPSHAFAKPAKLDAAIMDAAETVAEALQGSVHAMHAWLPLPQFCLPMAQRRPTKIDQIAAEAERNARAALDQVCSLPRGKCHLVEGQACEAIARTVRKLGCDILVMGAVSRSGLKRVFIGNTAEEVLKDLECDVLVVKPATFATSVRRIGRGVRYVGAARLPTVAS